MGKKIERNFLITGNGWQDTPATNLCLRSLIEMCPHIVKFRGLTRDLEEFSGGNAG